MNMFINKVFSAKENKCTTCKLNGEWRHLHNVEFCEKILYSDIS